MNRENECMNGRGSDGHRKGPSSFHMQDSKLVMDALAIKGQEHFLDLGCGAGEYALEISSHLSEDGLIYAVDSSPYIVEGLINEVQQREISNIKPLVSDMTKNIALKDHSVDVCLISTVLHALDLDTSKNIVFGEIKRILRPGGRLVVIECNSERKGYGPPVHMRINPQALDEMVLPYGFIKVSSIDLGYNYMTCYSI